MYSLAPRVAQHPLRPKYSQRRHLAASRGLRTPCINAVLHDQFQVGHVHPFSRHRVLVQASRLRCLRRAEISCLYTLRRLKANRQQSFSHVQQVPRACSPVVVPLPTEMTKPAICKVVFDPMVVQGSGEVAATWEGLGTHGEPGTKAAGGRNIL
jgi:hypothetical protein